MGLRFTGGDNKALQWFSVSASIKAEVHRMVFEACIICTPPPAHTHIPTRTVTSSPLLTQLALTTSHVHFRPTPVSRPIYQLCPLPEILFPQISTWLTPPLPSEFCSNVTFSLRPILIAFGYTATSQHPSTTTFLSF